MEHVSVGSSFCDGCLPDRQRGSVGEAGGEQKTPETGCVATAEGPLADAPVAVSAAPVVRVGKKAPDFEANAFHQGGFKNLKLSSLAGKWVVLCFYPGDFTFV